MKKRHEVILSDTFIQLAPKSLSLMNSKCVRSHSRAGFRDALVGGQLVARPRVFVGDRLTGAGLTVPRDSGKSKVVFQGRSYLHLKWCHSGSAPVPRKWVASKSEPNWA